MRPCVLGEVRFGMVSCRGVRGPVRFGFNPKIQPNRKIIVLVNITRTEPKTSSNRTGFGRGKGEGGRLLGLWEGKGGKGGGRLLGLWEKEGGKGEKGVERL